MRRREPSREGAKHPANGWACVPHLLDRKLAAKRRTVNPLTVLRPRDSLQRQRRPAESSSEPGVASSLRRFASLGQAAAFGAFAADSSTSPIESSVSSRFTHVASFAKSFEETFASKVKTRDA